MKKVCLSVLTVAALTASPLLTKAHAEQTSLSMQNSVENSPLSISLSGRYVSGAAFATGGAEIVAYDTESQQMYSINGDAGSVDILDGKALNKSNRFTDIPLQKQLFPMN